MKHAMSLLALMATLLPAWAQTGVPMVQSGEFKDVRIRMYIGSDRALVRESCQVYLPMGTSEVRFKWIDADIDGAEVRLEAPAGVRVGGMRQPVGETNCVAWPVEVDSEGVRTLTACYFVRGLNWSATYEVVFDAAAGNASLVGRLHLSNDSRLPLRDAHLELCAPPTALLDASQEIGGRGKPGVYATIEHCDLEPGWQKRVVFIEARDIPARVVYRLDWEATRAEARRFLLLDLRPMGGPQALPQGHLELYERQGAERTWVLSGDLVPAADKETELALGVERQIIFQRTTTSWRKTEVQFDRVGRVSGFDTTEEISAVVRSRLTAPAQVEMVERVPGKWELDTRVPPTKREANLVQWDYVLEPGERREITFRIIRHIGSRAG